MPRKPPARGDVVKVTWVDIYEDATGNPDTAKFIERVSYGLLWVYDEEKLVTTTTIDPDDHYQQGWCCYPRGVVRNIEVIKRAAKNAV